MNMWPDILGYIGVLFVLIAYSLQQVRRIDGNGLLYPLLNLIGACLILVSLFHKPNLPAMMMEIAWAIVSLIGIFIAIRLKNSKPKS
jgi:paired small multidrug resistance pump